IIVRGANITAEDRAAYELSDLRLSTLYAKVDKNQNDSPANAATPTVDPSAANDPWEQERRQDGVEPRRVYDPEAPRLVAPPPSYQAPPVDERMAPAEANDPAPEPGEEQPSEAPDAAPA